MNNQTGGDATFFIPSFEFIDHAQLIEATDGTTVGVDTFDMTVAAAAAPGDDYNTTLTIEGGLPDVDDDGNADQFDVTFADQSGNSGTGSAGAPFTAGST